MAGTRAAPVLTGAATYKQISVHYIDNSGDVKSDSTIVPIAATQAQIEAHVAGLQLLSNASIYKVEVNQIWGSDALADLNNAEGEEPKSASVFDTATASWKHTDPNYAIKRVPIPAPIGALFIGAGGGVYSDQIDPANADLVTLFGATLAMLGAGWGVSWVRYTEHREINERTRV